MAVPEQTTITNASVARRQRIAILIVAVIAIATLNLAVHFRAKHQLASPKSPEATHIKVRQSRTIFPLSVIHGGAYTVEELARARRSDAVVAAHYAGFGQNPSFQKTTKAQFMYVSYRRGNHVFWSKIKHQIPQGETLISDGTSLARARCGNRLSEVAQGPVAASQPFEEVMNTPEAPDELGSYQLADLPGPTGHAFDLALPSSAESSPAGTTPAAIAGGGPGSTLTPSGGYSPFGQSSFGGGGVPPVKSTATGSTPGSNGGITGSPVPPGVTLGGNTLPTGPNYPVSPTLPVDTIQELSPEPAAFFLTAFGLLSGLATWKRRGSLLRS